MSLAALFAGVSGLNASSSAMQVVSNNIANMNTVGFKGSRSVFSELVGTSGAFQVGRGARLNSISPVFTQGSFETSANPLDLGVEGGGFFLVKDNTGTYYTRSGQFDVDKDGKLVNPDGLTLQGVRTLDGTGNIIEAGGDLVVPTTPFSSSATANVQANVNLDSRTTMLTNSTETDPTTAFLVTDPTNTSNFSTGITMYDSLGNSHLATIYFRKASEGSTNNTWEWYAVTGASDTLSGEAEIQEFGSLVFDNSGKLAAEFVPVVSDTGFAAASTQVVTVGGNLNIDLGGITTPVDVTLDAEDTLQDVAGKINDATDLVTASVIRTTSGSTTPFRLVLTSQSSTELTTSMITQTIPLDLTFDFSQPEISADSTSGSLSSGFDFSGGPAADQAVEFNFGTSLDEDATAGLDGTTQFGATSVILFQDQDGYPTGMVQRVSVSDNGTITGLLTNGQNRELGQVALAIFNNPNGLTPVGNNRYSKSLDSGEAIVGKPKSGAAGKIVSGALEMSNVDLGEQFIKMIILQRGFQANSRVITTNDDILGELVNIKR